MRVLSEGMEGLGSLRIFCVSVSFFCLEYGLGRVETDAEIKAAKFQSCES